MPDVIQVLTTIDNREAAHELAEILSGEVLD